MVVVVGGGGGGGGGLESDFSVHLWSKALAYNNNNIGFY